MVYKDYTYLDGHMFEQFIISGANKLHLNVKTINELNVFPIPDGDTGDNMHRTIAGGIEKMVNTKDDSLSIKAKTLAEGMLYNARGNSGVILSQLFAGIAKGFENKKIASIDDIVYAFEEGVRNAYKAVVPPVEGTILTVAREAVEKTKDELHLCQSIGAFGEIFTQHMYASLERTPELLDVLKEAGVIDSGGAGLLMIVEGIKDAIFGNLVEDITNYQNHNVSNIDLSLFTEDSELTYGYCTEVLLRLMTKKVDVKSFDEQIIIDYLNTIGDSIVCFKTDSIVKIHVHTMEPYKVLEFTQRFGEFLTIKIENMTLQHNETHQDFKKEEKLLPDSKRKRIKYSSIIVADGEGIIDLFKELGVDYVIDGGQGNNPSINDFLEAFDRVNAENIFVFPNNSNIILAAKQAKEVYTKSNIYVMESKNIGEAYSALSMLDYSFDNPDDLYQSFVENMHQNKTALICRAIRDVNMNGIDVKDNNYISIMDKRIESSSTTIEETVHLLLKSFEELNIITLFYGIDVSSETKATINQMINKYYPRVELYEMDGLQETFDIIMIIE